MDLPPTGSVDESLSTPVNFSILANSTKSTNNKLCNTKNISSVTNVKRCEDRAKRPMTYTANLIWLRTPYSDAYMTNNSYFLRVRSSEKSQRTLITSNSFTETGNFPLQFDKLITDAANNRLWIDWKCCNEVIMRWDFVNMESIDVRIFDVTGADMALVGASNSVLHAEQVSVDMDLCPNDDA